MGRRLPVPCRSEVSGETEIFPLYKKKLRRHTQGLKGTSVVSLITESLKKKKIRSLLEKQGTFTLKGTGGHYFDYLPLEDNPPTPHRLPDLVLVISKGRGGV